MSVCKRSHGWTVWATDLAFGTNIAFHNIPDKFEGQGQRSSSPFWKTWFSDLFYGITYVNSTEPFCHDTWRDVTAWCCDALLRLFGKNADKEGTLREGVSTLRRSNFAWFQSLVTVLLAGQNNIVVSCNPIDPCLKPPTQKVFWPFSGKSVTIANSSDVLWCLKLLQLWTLG